MQVAKLLTDTSVGQFYPTLFVLATDIMDMLGDMVWERIKQKAEFAEDGSFLFTLPGQNFGFLPKLILSQCLGVACPFA